MAAIRRYTSLRRLGFSPQAIKVLLAGGTAVPFPVHPGITLQVDPQLIGGALDADALVDRVRQAVAELLMEPSDAERRAPPRQRSR